MVSKLPEICRKAAHVFLCNEAGQVDALQQTIGFLERWLEEVDTEAKLIHCLVSFAWVGAIL